MREVDVGIVAAEMDQQVLGPAFEGVDAQVHAEEGLGHEVEHAGPVRHEHIEDRVDDAPASDWVDASMAELAEMDNVTIMLRTTLFGYYDHNVLAALERVNDHVSAPDPHQPRQRMWTIRAGEVVLACGSHERALTFDNNDKPGVMRSGAVRAIVERFGVAPGKKIVLCGNNDDIYKTAATLKQAGVDVVAIADSRAEDSAAAIAAR